MDKEKILSIRRTKEEEDQSTDRSLANRTLAVVQRVADHPAVAFVIGTGVGTTAALLSYSILHLGLWYLEHLLLAQFPLNDNAFLDFVRRVHEWFAGGTLIVSWFIMEYFEVRHLLERLRGKQRIKPWSTEQALSMEEVSE